MENSNQKSLPKINMLLGLSAIIFFAVIIIGAGYKTVRIEVDGEVIEARTVFRDPEKIVEEQEIQLTAFDRVEVLTESYPKSEETIIVHRGRKIRVNDGGQEAIHYTSWNTVEDTLAGLKININPEDRLNPGEKEELQAEDRIEITRVREKSRRVDVELPYSTEINYVSDLEPDEQRVVQPGEPGILLETYIDTYENRERVTSRLQEQELRLTPRPEIIEMGEGNYFTTADGSTVRYEEKFTMEATAYTAGYESTGKRPGDPAYGVTRSGTRVRPGVVAVDPEVIPLGTKLYVESLDGTRSYGYSTAEDTGGDIKGKRIDLYFEQLGAARRYGRRDVRVYILD